MQRLLNFWLWLLFMGWGCLCDFPIAGDVALLRLYISYWLWFDGGCKSEKSVGIIGGSFSCGTGYAG
ncbi:hypothetical protein NIES267_16690 [Calothrix parasitica NIES-267]|uniref:Uncharacterized protein n=1 Tax=Calothrix parasitica NIES-267 TaxID=1973488 RepID=A0A1Z4LLT3_9CYAN|nr:hypothetical protein NIES267_16690 [Calothrix parasitica NIES-267]